MTKLPPNEGLTAKVENAPRSPGVYLMKDKDGKVIYVGKALDLKSRIRSYFGGTDGRFMVPFLVSRIADIEFFVTETEKEALILENNLIKVHRPRYNVDFRDDKAYFHIRIDPSDPYARFALVRRPKKDGARYFGPYPSSAAAKETLRFLQPLFRLRTCRDRDLRSRSRPCLEFEIGRCSAPCVGRVDAQTYRGLVRDALAFIEGRGKKLLSNLRERMNAAASSLDFEEAAVLRDRIAAIEATLEKQRIVSMSFRDRDAFGLYREGNLTQICAVHVRGGKLLGRRIFPLVRIGAASADILSSLLKQYFDAETFIPEEIYLPEAVEDGAVIEQWLSERRGKRVAIRVPRRGEGRDIVEMAAQNAENVFKTQRRHEQGPKETLDLMARKLQLKNRPSRIECCDISNIGGQYATGSLVAFREGLPDKGAYRHFRIRNVEGADDYAMMYEVLRRRLEKKEALPDLIVVDGGKGQLGVALSVLRDLSISGVDVIGLAKEREGMGMGASPGMLRKESAEDRVYLPRKKEPLYPSRWPPVLFLLQRIRDEAHRFALFHHRKLKGKSDLRSVLDGIPGIGVVKKKALLERFGDIRRLRQAPPEEIAQLPGIGPQLAKEIHGFFRKGD
ncbi:MAG: excinuclease ABC subunit UvrC [Deltaproteobacteria bacterium]|nr:excinuclease ABC subunit UvrC [Deltaproteobacteria bacterium]